MGDAGALHGVSVTRSVGGYRVTMVRRIREEYIDDEPIVTRRRVVTERRVGGPVGFGPSPVGLLLLVVVLVFVLAFFLGIR